MINSGPCQQFAPMFIELAAEIKRQGIDAICGKIDGTQARNSDLANKLEVTSYPTIGMIE